MVRKELIKRSPLRILEKSTHGGIGKGSIGLIASPKGVGKTACLVHIATDLLLQGKHVIHVSFATRTDHIISWYEDIYKELAKTKGLEDAVAVHDEIIRNRMILNFNQEGVKIEQVAKSIKSMIEAGSFAAECVMIDGFDLRKSPPADLKSFQKFLADEGLAAWFAFTLTEAESDAIDHKGTPNVLVPYVDTLAVLITLQSKKDHIALHLVRESGKNKDTDIKVQLDPKTLLLIT